VQHAVAAALIHGKAGLEQFTDACVRDPQVLALREKIEVLRDPSFATVAAAVDLWTADGRQHRLSQTAARGSVENPVSDRDLEEKLRAIADTWCPGYDARPLIDAIWSLDRSDDVSKLAALTVPRR
jgi:2-methylcitrate dehydratase PrpD